MFEPLKKFWLKISNGPRESQAFAFQRIGIGLFFLYHGHDKLTNPAFADQLSKLLQGWSASSHIGFYQQFLNLIAIPHADVFASLVIYSELFVGLSYVLGFLVAFSAPVGVLLNLNYLLATQHTGWAALGVNMVCLMAHMSLFWGRAGRHYGFDAYVFRNEGKPAEKPAYGKSSKKLKAVKEAIEKSQKGGKGGGKKGKVKSKPF